MFDRSRGLGMVARPSAELAIAQRVQLAPQHYAVDRWDRTALDDRHQRLTMRLR